MLLAPYRTAAQASNEPNNLYIRFSSVFSSLGYIRPDIKLEIGAFAVGTPFVPAKIRSYVSEQFPEISENNADVSTVSVEQTFWAKTTILHYLNFLPTDSATPLRHSRHYYDVFMLANSKYREQIFSASNLLTGIIAFNRKFYPKRGVNYDEMSLQTLKLLPPPSRSDDLQQDYQQMQDMIFGDKPTWQELLRFLAAFEKELHAL